MDYLNMEDRQLLRLLEAGDETAFAEIYNRHWKLLYTSARNLLQDEFAAQEVTQEVFIALWQRRSEAAIQEMLPYLRKAIRFQALKALRNLKNTQAFQERLANITACIVYEDPLVFKEQAQAMQSLMDGLPEDCRTIFILSREAQLTYKAIAVRLNISEKTVEKKMSTCLRYFRETLAKKDMLCTILLATWMISAS